MPIPLGVLAQAGAGGGGGGVANAYEWLETTILTGTQTSISFSNLDTSYASTYQHLQLRIVAKNNRSSSAGDNIRLRLNGVSSNAYWWHHIYGQGASVITQTSGGITDAIYFRFVAGNNFTPFSPMIIDMVDAFEAGKNRTIRALYGTPTPESSQLNSSLLAGFWNNTSAISSIELTLENSSSFVSGTRVSLYGLKGA
jgi:hypothetical protein